MIESRDIGEPLSEIEAMVRSAANYVQVSKDLRPRVLESSRLTNGERRARRHIRQAALVAALLTWGVTTTVNQLDVRENLRELSLATAATAGAYPISNNRASVGASDAAWELVDAYTELRLRQAEVLRLKL